MVANETEGRAKALRRIAACHSARAEELDLGGLQLTALDGELLGELCQLGWLRQLFLGPSAEAREKPQLVFTREGKNSKVCNALGALPGALFGALRQLERLDLALNSLRGLPHSIANLLNLTSLDLASNETGAEGAKALKGLVNLTSLNVARNKIGAEGAQALKGLVNLTSLNLAGNFIGDGGATVLKGLVNLTSLDLADNKIGAEGAQALKGLINLASLNLSFSQIEEYGAQALGELTSLRQLQLANNRIGRGVKYIANLPLLTELDLINNDIRNEDAKYLGKLKCLENLTLWCTSVPGNDGYYNRIGSGLCHLSSLNKLISIDLSNNEIGNSQNELEGLLALGGLRALTTLNLSGNKIGAEGAQALKGLVNLTNLNLARNEIGAKGVQALQGLVNLTSLDLAHNEIGSEGVQALQGLINLTNLNLSGNPTGSEGVRPLQGLINLTSLDLAGNHVGNISPLVSLRHLQAINLSGSHIENDVPSFWMLPTLQEAILHDAHLLGVPVEILSKDTHDDCLGRLRAHLADLTGDDVAVSDVKLMVLGNGRVGKTQICRRLRGESFDEGAPSTHGIQVSSVPLAPQIFGAPVSLKIWDFGGQDIYHGTHALFLKSRAIFPLVWTPKSEEEQFHTHGGFTFRNHPLAYWLAYTRTFGGVRSPVLIIQSQCDRPEDEGEPPLPPGALDGFGYKKVLHYSAKGDGTRARGHAALEETLVDAVQWMRGNEGVAKIGPGRAIVREALEAKLAAGQRLISHQSYLALCAEVGRTRRGRVTDPALLLEYLHDSGAVFYRKGLFGDQIILDQAWALDAVYALFDRTSQSFRKIERNHGRFRRSELAEWVWQEHGVPEQELFLERAAFG